MKSFYNYFSKILFPIFFSQTPFVKDLSLAFNSFILINLFETIKLNHKNFL